MRIYFVVSFVLGSLIAAAILAGTALANSSWG